MHITKKDDYKDLVARYNSIAYKQLDCIMLPQYEYTRIVKGETIFNGWFLVRRNPKNIESIPEVRVAVIGNVDAGKSTMLGVLTSGNLDDGRGKARLGLFRHKHEIDSGRTSSIGQEILAFGQDGKVVARTCYYGSSSSSSGAPNFRRSGWDEICPEAHKVITFMDLAGHEKYLKTTMFGLTGGAPDYAMLMVGANAGLIGMAKEHLALAFALSMPVLVVISKVDMCPENILDGTIRQLQKILKSPSAKRTPMLIKTAEDVILASQNFVAQRLCPIFQVSNVSGEGIEMLKNFLHLLPQSVKYSGNTQSPVEFQITETYVVQGVGTVVAGTMISGTVSLGQTLYLGPDSNGTFIPCPIKGIQRKRVNVPRVVSGQCASFALKKIKRGMIRKGMVLLGKELIAQPLKESRSCYEFEAEVVILFHSTTIGPKYQAMLHCGVVRQTVTIISMKQDILRTGDRALVRFRFIKSPEYLKVDSRLLFREGRTKGVGRITTLFD